MGLSRMKKIAAAGAAAAAIGGISFGASAFASEPGAHPAAAPAAAPVHKAVHKAAPKTTHKAGPVRQLVARGRVDGQAWSVTLEFHPTLPAGYTVEPPPPGTPQKPDPTSLLCQRMVIGGVRIDHQGGPWADCQPLTGAHDPSWSGSEGLWGLHDKGTTGSRLFVGDSAPEVAYGVVRLTDGGKLTGRAATVPGTDYHAWAVAVPDGKYIASVDTYDAGHHRLTHETEWH
ncbi:hypothetical protein SAMN05216251_101461 [Actinacidiphila alni]|uniref:Uncharacterized protein n=1 Tax=Actinacidiphila alni TaxID=380248 RepID=A0A1I1XN13_9ACTN|nr:hypothetical protein [Actinacidiphila alni]SFE08754.1 hypothetical protein SAMN05216251_101461 [Actinacidiphila alni]